MKITKTKKGLYTTVVGLGQDRSGKMRTKRFTAPSKDALLLAVASYRAEDYEAEHRPRTFEEALDAYITARESLRSASTLRGYKSVQRSIKERCAGFCGLPVPSVDDRAVQAIVDDLQKDGYTPKTIRNWVGLINSVLIAEKRSPVRVILPQRRITDREIPTEAEIRMLLCLLHGSRLEVPFNLAILSLRRSEICAITADDLDSRNILHVHKGTVQLDGGGVITKNAPKTDTSNRFIQLPADIADLIRRQGRATTYGPSALTKAYSQFLAKYKFPPYRLHDCRHFFASYCHEHGVPEADILAGGGWKTANVMKSVYRHSMARNRAGAAITSLRSR